MTNDVVFIRRPIKRNMLEAILFEVDRVVHGQPYLISTYRANFALAYYGLFRIGELVKGGSKCTKLTAFSFFLLHFF